MALRRKAQRQAKLGRQREKKQLEKIKLEQEKKLQVEEEERKRFLALSDREKVSEIFFLTHRKLKLKLQEN